MKRQVFNPYLPSYEYIPDGEPYVFDGRIYIYGSHDKFNGNDYCLNNYVCWSAPVEDLSDWKFEGEIFRKEQHPYHNGRNILFAPDVTKGADGRYYLYYSMAHSSIMSVAVCDTPAGKYEYYGDVVYKSGEKLGEKSGEYYQFDPGIFVDEDGRIFLYSGFCPQKEQDEEGRLYVGAHMVELEADMLSVKSGPKVVISRDEVCPEGARYFEAPSMRKINDVYYLVYSAKNTGLHYYYSKYPDKEFIYGGCIHSTSDVGINGHTVEKPAYPVGNTHGGIVCIQGQYYIFDHRLTNNSSFCRQGVAEPIIIDKTGRIHQVEATSCGLNRGPLAGKGKYPSYIACNLIDNNDYASKEERQANTFYITQDGEDRECGPDQYLKGIKNGCIAGYKYFDIRNLCKITLTIKGNATGSLRLSLKEQANYIANIPINISNQQWKCITMDINISDGIHAFYLEYIGQGEFDLLDFTLE